MADEPIAPFRHVPAAEGRAVEMLAGVTRRTLGWGDRMLLAEITLREGSLVPPHSHHHEQIGYLMKGQLEFTIGGGKTVVSAGDGYTIAGGVTHSALALVDSVAIEVFSPVREEYR